MLALTFDDGPSASTPHILDLLEQYGGRATFCVLGEYVANNKSVIKRAAALGSEVVGHSWDHKDLSKCSVETIQSQLTKTNDAIEAVLGVRPALYRPPYGAVNERVVTVSKDLGMSLLLWSVDTLDWKDRDATIVYNRIMNSASNGSIILCHDLHATTAAAMDKVIPALIEKGYQLVTVSELLASKGIAVTPGMKIFQG